MTTVTTCCTPCAAVPVAPQPVTTVAAPAPSVTGGGAPGTVYSPAQAPASTGQYVPAPKAGDTPPEPIAAPAAEAPLPATPAPTATDGAATAPAANGSTAPAGSASAQANWPQWKAEFSKLGVSAEDVARIGALPLSNTQLANVYEQVFLGVQQGGPAKTTPTDGSTAPTKAGGWDPSWDAKFLALGMSQDQVTALAAKAKASGATTADIEAVYQQAVQQVGQTPGTPGQVEQGPGWSKEWEARFAKLGMPADIIKVYAESGANTAGLEAALNTATEKFADFQARGWVDKFTKAGVPAYDMWAAIISEPKLDDKVLQSVVDGARSSHMNGWQKALQAGITFFPGGELVQYVFGEKAISHKEIDRTNVANIAFAALSGLALFASIKGVANISRGFKAIGGGLPELTKTGIATQGLQVAEDTALGATRNWGAKQKILSLVPGTQMHRLVTGAGHAEAAARAFNNGGASQVLKQADGAFLANKLGSMFDDIKTGRTLVQGSGNAYIGMLAKRTALPMTMGVTKDGQQVINVARSLRIGDGRSQLAALAGAAGERLAASGEVSSTGKSLASIMAGNVARATGIGNDGVLATLALKRASAATAVNPSWYLDLAARTATGGGAARAVSSASAARAATAARAEVVASLTPETHAIIADAVRNQRTAMPAVLPVAIKAPVTTSPAAASHAAASVIADTAPLGPATQAATAAAAVPAPKFTTIVDAAGRPMLRGESGKAFYIADRVPTGNGTIDPKAIAAFSDRLASGG